MTSSFPVCAVLLATYNGERWLPEQLESLSVQQGVDLSVIVSDDQSSDRTMHLLVESSNLFPLAILPPEADRFGGAIKNFLRLIRDADIGEAEYVALADQDDIWKPEKLAHAICRLRVEGAAGYSSDFEAFWPDGRKLIVKKSYEQKKFDHLFGSPGPGCTYVFTRLLFSEMRSWVIGNYTTLSQLWAHDWIIYAYARSRGYRWLIDNKPMIRYRQHMSNEIGVNFGLKAAHRRLAWVKDGRYRLNIVTIAELTNTNPECVLALRRLKWYDRLWLIRQAHQFRRSFFEVWALRLIFVLMPARNIPAVELVDGVGNQ
jgi:rhamnosyltransferase